MQIRSLIVSLLAIVGIAAAAFSERGGLEGRGLQYLLTTMIGAGAGFALYHASFGFTGAWRRLVRERRGAGLRAQLILIGLTCLITFPLMVYGREIAFELAGQQVSLRSAGNILPMGVASALGAFMFGIGMQLGGGCASGTLFTVGGGSTRMVITLFFFVAGSVLATAHYDVWGSWPFLNNKRGISLVSEFGLTGALLLMGLLLATIWAVTIWIERRAHNTPEPRRKTRSLLTGPWSLVAGAVALALVGGATMAVTGRPWGVTWGFALWGAEAADALNFDVRSWTYWQGWRAAALDHGIFGVATSVMNLGIIFGAMAAASLAGHFAPVWRLSARDILTAVIGGLLMGYGARMAYGCNIGAYLGGVVSGSLHGWWWLIWGFSGSFLGTRLRAILEMDPPLPKARATV